jgi:hypothetical protein
MLHPVANLTYCASLLAAASAPAFCRQVPAITKAHFEEAMKYARR